MNIIFMGTPDFALPSLSRLIADGHRILAVLTQPDKPQGRHMIPVPPPVKQLALAHDIPVHQPQSLKDESVQAMLRNYAPELMVVVAYGKILPQAVLDIPEKGCVNLHGSLLPCYRGAAPIQWAVIRGERKTGVTVMRMDAGLDTGPMLSQHALRIDPDETAGTLFDRVAQLGALALSEALSFWDTLTPAPQDESRASWAPPLQKQDGLLDFSQEAPVVYNRLRGVTPAPGAFAMLGEKRLKIHRAALCEQSGAPGVLLDGKQLIVGCGTGALHLLEVQPEGGKRMAGAALIHGKRLRPGDTLFV